ncbi:MAG TPA: NUDIX domain-containing protein, partial [Candidatus Deferrimicrobiaceae bacterium]|nr:NUDIX domain-containing protein [Candidatus Deferrimicrobiaceae bacterium]
MKKAERFFSRLRGVLSPVGASGEAPEGLRPAGVLVPLRTRNGEVTVVLARRTERVPHHKGQVCFPGGSRDPGDADLFATALREAEE